MRIELSRAHIRISAYADAASAQLQRFQGSLQGIGRHAQAAGHQADGLSAALGRVAHYGLGFLIVVVALVGYRLSDSLSHLARALGGGIVACMPLLAARCLRWRMARLPVLPPFVRRLLLDGCGFESKKMPRGGYNSLGTNPLSTGGP